MSAMDQILAAVHRELRAQEELLAARAAKEIALLGLHREGVPKCHVGKQVRESMIMHGFTSEHIGRLALSDASVRLFMERRLVMERGK